MTLDFINRRVLCSHEDVSFNIICLNVLEGNIQFYLSKWFRKNRLETSFKGDDVKALIKTSNCEKLVLYFSEKNQKIAAFAMLIWFSLTIQSLKNVFWLTLMIRNTQDTRHFSTATEFGNFVFLKWKFLSDDRRLYLHDSK